MSRPGAEPALDYARLVRELFPRLTGGIRWGLERTERMLADAGNPERAYPVIHIGGTNGKGSACAVAEAVLRAAGLRTGLYTSPHLTSFRERIRIGGALIEESALLESARRLWPSIVREEPSFFEATTAIAFDAFARAQVDVAVVEVGLGGRLDSTNVVVPEVAVVTNVAVDHQEFLGSEPAGIAVEKAGIAKPGVPFLTGEPDDALFAVLSRIARDAGAHVHRAEPPEVLDVGLGGTRFSMPTAWGFLDARLPLIGAHQAGNAALALRAIELTGLESRVSMKAVFEGVEATRWPGRFQVERVAAADWIFDVAHNPSAIARLATTLRELAIGQPLVALLGVMGDKDWRAMIASIAPVADRIVLTRPARAPAGRAWLPDEVARALAAEGFLPAHARVDVVPDLPEAVRTVGASGAASVLVTGSFHTVGEAMIALGIDPGWEPDPDVDPALQR